LANESEINMMANESEIHDHLHQL